MISVEKVKGTVGEMATRTLDGARRLFWTVRGSRFVRKFSWIRVLKYAVLSFFIAFYGMMVGVMIVIMPPMVAIGATALPVLFLIFAAPALRSVPTEALRKVFYFVLFVETSVPVYYAVQLPGLPWISIRRAVVLVAIILCLISVAGSAKVRSYIYQSLSADKKIFICFAGYYFMCAVSLLSSANITESTNQLLEYTLNWYIPAIACVVAIKTIDDVRGVLRLIGLFSLFVAVVGVMNFMGEHNYVIDLIPRAILEPMMAANPSMEGVMHSSYRNGLYRSTSIFNVCLSYGEFAAIVAPIGGYFLLHGEKASEKALGLLVILGAMTGLYVSGARGGSVAFIVAMPMVFALWVIRMARANPRGMAGPLGGAFAFMGTTTLIGLVFFVGKLHKMILGGGDTASSDTSRSDQAALAWPHILANPITGHGVGNGAEVINYHSPGGGLTIDSAVLSVVVETGVPGLLFFTGMLAFSTWAMMRVYVRGTDRESAVGVAMACSIVGYTVYRLVLAQRENQSLLFILVALSCIVAKIFADRAEQPKLEESNSVFSKRNRAFVAPKRLLKPAMTSTGNVRP